MQGYDPQYWLTLLRSKTNSLYKTTTRSFAKLRIGNVFVVRYYLLVYNMEQNKFTNKTETRRNK